MIYYYYYYGNQKHIYASVVIYYVYSLQPVNKDSSHSWYGSSKSCNNYLL